MVKSDMCSEFPLVPVHTLAVFLCCVCACPLSLSVCSDMIPHPATFTQRNDGFMLSPVLVSQTILFLRGANTLEDSEQGTWTNTL